MRIVEKSQYKHYLAKARQHADSGACALQDKAYDAAVTNFSIAIINFLDAASVNRFGKDLSSGNHEAAPVILQKQFSGAGVLGFRKLSDDCVEILRMKNIASYRSELITAPQARRARDVVGRVREFVDGLL